MKIKLDLRQDDLALSSVASHQLFPGRITLYVPEVAKALGVSIQHVINLIEEYQDTGGKSGLLALDVSNAKATKDFKAGNKTNRGAYRVPVSAFDAYVTQAAGLPPQTQNQTKK